jgi:DNA-nicking Smr family endonuclease
MIQTNQTFGDGTRNVGSQTRIALRVTTRLAPCPRALPSELSPDNHHRRHHAHNSSSLETLRGHHCAVFIRRQSWLNSSMDEGPIELPIDGVLDLHTFRPKEVKELVLDYLAECQRRGILRVRIIHGKGIGNLRRTVHTLLAKHPEVVSFNLAGEHFGGWGATIVGLKPDGPKGQ